MKVFNISELSPAIDFESVLCIGNFDGVHLGHKKLIEHAKNFAGDNLQLSVLTFEPHPISYFKPDLKNYRISNLKEKTHKFEMLGVENLFIAKFDESFAKIEAEEFIKEILLKKTNSKIIVTGEDYCFGKGRAGSLDLLAGLSNELGYQYKPVDLHHLDGEDKVSSSQIRKLLKEGELQKANDLLGLPYFVFRKVVSGKGEGKRSLGFATANLDISDEEIIPKYGVYNCVAKIDEKKYKAAVNIGERPSFDDGDRANVEAHILGYEGELNDKCIKLEFHEYLRNEKKFEDLLELKSQIEQDIAKIRKSNFV